MRPLAVESLSVRCLRNLREVDVRLGPRFNVLSGENGQGKTNLLEAIYLVCTSRSFRTSRLADLVRQGGPAEDEITASVRARVSEGGEMRDQSVGIRTGLRAARVDGRRPLTLVDYALRTPAVVFHPGILALATGSGAERRKLLDRLALYLSPGSLADGAGYAKAARARQRVLDHRGVSSSDLDGWEDLMVRYGHALSVAREAAALRLGAAAEEAFARIGPGRSQLRASYRRSAPPEVASYRATLAVSRAIDRGRGWAGVGPHRDDLVLDLSGRPVRGLASQGQQRAVVLALELAEIELVAHARDAWPILLLDDVSSELDPTRTRALFAALCQGRGQVIVTTTRPDLVDTSDSFGVDDRRDFSVVDGDIRPS
jgi:DNA replication and repair protein RecF